LKLPRDLAGTHLARLLQRYGYKVTRQTGSHMRLTSVSSGHEHHVTIPAHDPLKIGTLSAIMNDVAGHLGLTRRALEEELFR
jgi:predicted RNA binding protein YcfA (HicA-like mRNA interferase family)